jgi:hypothetical protein
MQRGQRGLHSYGARSHVPREAGDITGDITGDAIGAVIGFCAASTKPAFDGYFVVAMPPSTGMTAPVTYEPARLAR